MEQVSTAVAAFFSMIPFSPATWIVIFTTLFFVWLFAKANNNPKSAVNWEHLVIDSQNNRASPYKVGYLIGVIISTWIVIKISDGGDLSLDIFGVYLAFLLGGAGMNSYTKAREYGGPQQHIHSPNDRHVPETIHHHHNEQHLQEPLLYPDDHEQHPRTPHNN